ncbi:MULTISPECIES: hypothetical protein [unclassified Variovorax]|uniref:hypothetical protein n=1 Tax=unclassified Variovorax TaxID=663243 RepID=UPI0032E7ADB5
MRTTTFFAKRRFLKLALIGVGGAVAVAGGGVGYLTQTHRYRGRYGKLLALDDHHADIVHALAEACTPDRPGFPTVEQTEIVARLDEELFFVSDGICSEMKAALYLIEMLPLVSGHVSRLSCMPVAERRAFLAKASETRNDTVRVAVSSLAAAMRWYYYGHPASWNAIGYDGPFMQLPEQHSEQRVFYAELLKKNS